MTELSPTSPLDELPSPRGGAVSLAALPLCAKITLRGEPADGEFVAACSRVLGAPPPPANAPPARLDDERLVFCCGPNEWLLQAPLAQGPTLVAALEQALGGVHAAVVDVSDYYHQLRLAGAGVRAVLARHCPMDLHPRAFPAGRAVNTRMAKAAVLLHLVEEHCAVVQLRWSHAAYLWGLLQQSIEGGAGAD